MPIVDWQGIFAFSVSPFELILRGTLIYLFLVLVFRVILRRDVGSVGVADVLLLVIIADAAQNGMAGGYESVSDGLVLISTIIAWNVLFDWLAYRFPAVRRLLEAEKLLLISDGRYIHRNLRREFLSIEDVESKLREHGVEKAADVKAAYLESDGSISVIQKNGS